MENDTQSKNIRSVRAKVIIVKKIEANIGHVLMFAINMT